ncbi:sulfurtransferase complex subunit TusD [Candidatus Palibaumannia cicadellinicola]|uniref:Sulfurtransferase complex subunit TusD n=1 Tax=Candidatus Palibaumannia cicadellinicola TaxID=186490 RepID=A0A2N4XXH3_9GAMM|nr:sulfurtransferase complex subunit TusD [Candidatus Baumannia cicadellinicola]
MKKQLCYCLLITGPAYGNQRSSSALQFAKAVFHSGHYIQTVFFYQNGVYNANSFTISASDELNLVESWLSLAQTYNVSLHLCVTSALRRGIINMTQSLQFNKLGNNLELGFQLSGLGFLGETLLQCDRLIQF